MDTSPSKSGPLAFMAQHPVAANLLMIVFLVGGLFMTQEIRQEVFPDYELDEIRVNLSYPGSTPEDVEQALIRPVEDSIQNIAGVANMWSISREGGGRVTVEVVAGANEEMVMSEIQTAPRSPFAPHAPKSSPSSSTATPTNTPFAKSPPSTAKASWLTPT